VDVFIIPLLYQNHKGSSLPLLDIHKTKSPFFYGPPLFGVKTTPRSGNLTYGHEFDFFPFFFFSFLPFHYLMADTFSGLLRFFCFVCGGGFFFLCFSFILACPW